MITLQHQGCCCLHPHFLTHGLTAVRTSKKASLPSSSSLYWMYFAGASSLYLICHLRPNAPHSVSSLTVHICHTHNSETLKTIPAFMFLVQTILWPKTTSTNAILQVHTAEEKVYQNCFAELQGFCNNSDSEMCKIINFLTVHGYCLVSKELQVCWSLMTHQTGKSSYQYKRKYFLTHF